MPTDDLLIRPPGGADAPAHRPYDFARPLSFSTRQVRTAEAVHDILARALAARLSEALGEALEVHCTGIHEVLAIDFERSRTVPTALFRLRLDAPGGLAVGLDLAPALALFLVERHLGGTGPLGDAPRALTALEQRVVQRHWLPEILAAFADAWLAPAPRADGFESRPSRMPLAEPDDAVVSADLELVLGEQSVAMAFCYPAAAMRALLDARARAEAAPQPMPSTDALDEIPLDLRVELGRTTLSVADLLRLVPGDVLTLSRRADEPLPVHAGDRLLFEARPGASGRHVALQILSLHAIRPDAEDE